MSESSWSTRKYQTKNWREYNQALKARGSLTVWFEPDMQWQPPTSGKRGRSQSYSDAAIQCCLTLKVLFNLALRQTVGLVQSLIKLSGLSWKAPDFSTVCRRQKDLDVQVPYTPCKEGLHLLVDSSGMKFLGEGEWKTKKHGAERRRQWRKVHIGIDESNLQIRAIVVTTNEVGDSPVVPELLAQIPKDEAIESLTGDGAYDTETVYRACHDRQIMPVVPPRKRARLRKGAVFARRNEAIKACRQLGRSVWKDWSGYHRRSLVEAKMNCIKKLGERLKAKTFERQVVEINGRASILNRFTELGCPVTVAVR